MVVEGGDDVGDGNTIQGFRLLFWFSNWCRFPNWYRVCDRFWQYRLWREQKFLFESLRHFREWKGDCSGSQLE